MPLVKDRQAELGFILGPGKYIILPRTTGGLLNYKVAKFQDQPASPMLTPDGGQLSEAFSSVVDDIFKKFDIVMSLELSYSEFKFLY